MTQQQEHWLTVLKLAVEHDQTSSLLWNEEDGILTVAANCSDCFYWGCADAEEITPDNFGLYKQTVEECEALKAAKGHPSVFADELFAARVRKMRPQGASYHIYPPEMWPLFDACGPERDKDFGNPKAQPTKPEDAKGWNQPRRRVLADAEQELALIRAALEEQRPDASPMSAEAKYWESQYCAAVEQARGLRELVARADDMIDNGAANQYWEEWQANAKRVLAVEQ